MTHRIYLWLELVFDVIYSWLEFCEKDLRNILGSLLDIVEMVYKGIFAKIEDIEPAMNILHIVFAARRPLVFEGNEHCACNRR